ncbi:MAG: PTS sugar transporter subunit IIA [Gemmatimonadota bacterium]
MSSEGVRGIVIAHGEMAQGMVDAVRSIAGIAGDFLVPVSNRGLGPDALAAQVAAVAGSGATIVFTDLQSGSCGFAARRIIQGNPRLVVISGVNLPILLEFVMRREQPLEQLVPFLLKKGRAGIACAPSTYESNEHRAVSGG